MNKEEKKVYASWMKAEMTKDNREDYRFLRDNGIHTKTVLRMLALAYKTVGQAKGKQTEEEWLEENTGVCEEL